MNKKIIQDVLPPEDRSIRRIPLSKRQAKPDATITETEETKDVIGNLNLSPKKSKKRRYLLWALGILILIILFRLFAFAQAEVELKAKRQSVNVDQIFNILKDTGPALPVIPFEIIKVSEKSEKKIEASGEEAVEKKASGEIIIFNKHSTNSQILIQNTRFETPNGLIFRINQRITVPGMDEKNGEVVPGQIKVTVFADKPGEKYNIGLSDFTIPGFKGLPQFENFFARSATEMTGGFSGKMKTVEPGTLENARKELQSSLEPALRERIASEVPENFFLLPSTIEINFENSFEEEKGSNLVRIEEMASAYALVVNREGLESLIIENTLGETKDKIEVENLGSLDLKPEIEGDINNISSFQLSVKGQARLVWFIDEDNIKKDLVGQPKKSLESVMKKYPAVDEAKVTIKPFWKRSFPKKESGIYIKNELKSD